MSKLNEKIKIIADNLCAPKNEILENVTLDLVNEYLQEAAFKGYELCQKEYEEKLRWISVEEKLPENRERVLVKVLRSDKSTIIVTGSVVLDSKLGIYWQSGHVTQLNVTHWLSLSFL